jgi:ribonuclease HI
VDFQLWPRDKHWDELLGAWASLTLATRLSIPNLLLLGDSKIVIEWLNKRGDLQAVALESWKERILETLPLFRDISFAHIYREENIEADNLSKKALSNLPRSIAFTHWEDGNEGPTHYLKLF